MTTELFNIVFSFVCVNAMTMGMLVLVIVIAVEEWEDYSWIPGLIFHSIGIVCLVLLWVAGNLAVIEHFNLIK